MPRFEIVAYMTRDIECESFEEAVAIVKDQLGAERDSPDALLQLMVWQRKSPSGGSALPPYLRQQLIDFYAGVRRLIAENEEAFRGRVEVVAAPAPPLPGSGVAR